MQLMSRRIGGFHGDLQKSQEMTPGKNDSCGVFVQSKDTGGVKTLLKQSNIPSVEQKKRSKSL
jgi:hypothetical protein